MSTGQKSSLPRSTSTLSTSSPNPDPVSLFLRDSNIDLLPEDSEKGLWSYQEWPESHTVPYSPSMQSHVTLDDLSMTPCTAMECEVEFDFNAFIDVDLGFSQSALDSDVYPEFQAQDIVLENFSWVRQGNIPSPGFGDHQDDFNSNCLPNDPFISMSSATDDILGTEIYAINAMGRSSRKARRNLRCEWEGCKNSRQFNRPAELRRHVRTIHVFPKAYECTYAGCRQLFNRKDNLKEHMIKRHKMPF
ncbi:hypothetical protein ABOM_001656 [Aspergillus bombycis]|uniref:C2H2-type domain-containing protein n=1 Tax=Aspergillus bombycis TaxID=109264 RepID=A0A1F8ACU5_9EURO|nr:hypothetical protein ABOM_001656 [Aspergillus bombycis]OGM49576.1 hypothetical protein ABOM_001656 [Aspergillus bombycis]